MRGHTTPVNALSDEPDADQIQPRCHRHPRRLPLVDRRTLHDGRRAEAEERERWRNQLPAFIRCGCGLRRRRLRNRHAGNRATCRRRIRTATVATDRARFYPARRHTPHRPEGEAQEQEEKCQTRYHRTHLSAEAPGSSTLAWSGRRKTGRHSGRSEDRSLKVAWALALTPPTLG